MQIKCVRIENFRNFRKLDVQLASDVVIVGENKVGKSNLIFALRLLLDPGLPDSARQLRDEDFWDGVPRPLAPSARITISVDLVGFDDNDEQLASLADFLIEPEPMVARLTYVFRRSPGSTKKKAGDYEFIVYGGEREEARLGWETRKRIALDIVPALRDAEGDLAGWRRSPLRPVLAKAVADVDPDTKKVIAEQVSEAASGVLQVEPILKVERDIATLLERLVGPAQSSPVELGLTPSDPDRLFRSIRLLLDGGSRTVGDASLGVANTIYLALKLLEIRELQTTGARDHTFLAIEEPEAHLHPQLQRNIFRTLLRARHHVPTKPLLLGDASTSVIMTTHSPLVASVAPVRSLVLIRGTPKGSEAVSAANLELSKEEEADLERYLDVTRAEMLFSKAVMLVEGDAEVFVIPKIASMMGYDLDAQGITVCSVGGTNFRPHVRLLLALGIPFAVVTDYDEDDEGGNLGEQRVLDLLSEIMPPDDYDATDVPDLLSGANEYGVFLGEATFEIDVLRSGRPCGMAAALRETTSSKKARERATAWYEARQIPEEDEDTLLADIEAVGKGRYAQALARIMNTKKKGDQGPPYVMNAITYVVDQCLSN